MRHCDTVTFVFPSARCASPPGLLAESEAAERTAQTAYDSLSQKDAVAKAAKLAEVKGKQGEVKSLEMNLLNYKEDKESTLKELDAVLTSQGSVECRMNSLTRNASCHEFISRKKCPPRYQLL